MEEVAGMKKSEENPGESKCSLLECAEAVVRLKKEKERVEKFSSLMGFLKGKKRKLAELDMAIEEAEWLFQDTVMDVDAEYVYDWSVVGRCEELLEAYAELGDCPPGEMTESPQPSREEILAMADKDGENRREWFSAFMAVFDGIELENGWRLTSYDFASNLGGHTEFLLVSENGDVCDDILSHIVIKPSDNFKKGIDVVLMEYVLSQTGLSWHANYRRRHLMRSMRDFLDGRSFFGITSFDIFIEVAETFPHAVEKQDWLSPKVVEANDGLMISYSYFGPWTGFVKVDIQVPVGRPLGKIDRNEAVIAKYDCQIRF